MTEIRTIAEAEAVLAEYVPKVKAVTGKQITLERMSPLMEAFGNPHERLRIVHVAGTSGKTSTSYFIASLLKAAGKKVGLTVSPHVDTVAERVQIDMQPLEEPVFCTALTEYLAILEKTELSPTYFELLVCFAYWYFDRVGVDYAVVETGLGGMHDGTNIAMRSDKVCVITDIGLDHMHILGNSVAEIAAQKAGIIHEENDVFMLQQDEEIMRTVKQRCAEKHARLHVVEADIQHMPDALPEFQKRNVGLAYEVFKFLKERDGLEHIPTVQLANVSVPARMNEVMIGRKTIIMDGAHNEQKMQAFISSFQKKYPDKKVPVLFALKQGKEVAAVLPLVKQITSSLFITEYDWIQDLPLASLDAEELGAAAEKFQFERVYAHKNRSVAFDQFMNEVSDIGIITGSFYLVSQIRKEHEELKA